jgi:glycerate kinase
MQRIYPGASASLTFTVTTGGTYTAKVTDPLGRYIEASASESGGTATVTINPDAFIDGASGFGKVQVLRNNSGAKSVEASETIKFLPGIELDEGITDYAWM